MTVAQIAALLMAPFHLRLAFDFWYELPARERTRAKLLAMTEHYCQSYGIGPDRAASSVEEWWPKIPEHLKGEQP